MHQRIILLETSTSLCSAALLEDGEIVASRRSSEPRAHAAMTAPFVKEMLDERGLRVSDCDAVCLSMGPGSYTGLRVGSSTAKGLCFGGGIPLLAVSTLDVLVAQAQEEGLPEGCRYIVPMIDARRMEVYTAVYTADGQRLTDVAPVIVESIESLGIPSLGVGSSSCPLGADRLGLMHLEGTGSSSASSGIMEARSADAGGFGGNACSVRVHVAPRRQTADPSGVRPLGVQGDSSAVTVFIGDGVQKCKPVLTGDHFRFRQECPTADAMMEPALRELRAGNFRDTAYFEPFYLKDFIATMPKKLF